MCTVGEQGRYAMLNDMFMNVTLQENEQLQTIMKEYSKKLIATEEIFKLL